MFYKMTFCPPILKNGTPPPSLLLESPFIFVRKLSCTPCLYLKKILKKRRRDSIFCKTSREITVPSKKTYWINSTFHDGIRIIRLKLGWCIDLWWDQSRTWTCMLTKIQWLRLLCCIILKRIFREAPFHLSPCVHNGLLSSVTLSTLHFHSLYIWLCWLPHFIQFAIASLIFLLPTSMTIKLGLTQSHEKLLLSHWQTSIEHV